MRQRLHDYLLERPDGATPVELLSLVFTGQGRDPEFGARFLDVLLGSDQRFSFDPLLAAQQKSSLRTRAHLHNFACSCSVATPRCY